MKKRLLIISVLLFLTGCSCQYNVTIDGNKYKEEIRLIGSDATEISSFNNNWQVPVDKDDFNVGTDPDSTLENNSNIYKYTLQGNTLTFTSDFTTNGYQNSTAVSNCYKTFTVQNYPDSTIISSSQNTICFDKYPTLDSVSINITVDRGVKTHNADSVNGKTYTWHLTNSNHDKGINLILINDNPDNATKSDDKKDIKPNNNERRNNNITYYAFCGIILVIMVIGYFIFKNMVKKNSEMDD